MVQNAAQHLALRLGENAITICARFDEEEPVACGWRRRGGQIGRPAQGEVACTLVIEAAQAWCGARWRGDFEHDIALHAVAGLVGAEKEVGAFLRGLQIMMQAAPGGVAAIFDAGEEAPLACFAKAVAQRHTQCAATVQRVQLLHVADDDALLLAALQREDAHLEGAAVHPLQQRGVLHLVFDRLKGAACLLALRHAAFHELAVHIHRESRDAGIRRQRKVKRALLTARQVIKIRLIDGGARHAVLDMHIDMTTTQREDRAAIRAAQSTAQILRRRHWRWRDQHAQLTRPSQAVHGLRRGLDTAAAPPLTREQGLREACGSHLALRDKHFAFSAVQIDRELRPESDHGALRRLHGEGNTFSRCIDLPRDFDIGAAGFEFDFASAGNDHACVFIEIEQRVVLQALDAAFVVASFQLEGRCLRFDERCFARPQKRDCDRCGGCGRRIEPDRPAGRFGPSLCFWSRCGAEHARDRFLGKGRRIGRSGIEGRFEGFFVQIGLCGVAQELVDGVVVHIKRVVQGFVRPRSVMRARRRSRPRFR